MVQSILVPIELAHTQALETAVLTAGNLAKANDASITLIGVTGSAPNDAARNPNEFEEKLSAYAKQVSLRIGHPVATRTLVDNDVSSLKGAALVTKFKEVLIQTVVGGFSFVAITFLILAGLVIFFRLTSGAN